MRPLPLPLLLLLGCTITLAMANNHRLIAGTNCSAWHSELYKMEALIKPSLLLNIKEDSKVSNLTVLKPELREDPHLLILVMLLLLQNSKEETEVSHLTVSELVLG